MRQQRLEGKTITEAANKLRNMAREMLEGHQRI
jgi:hypothetical protein